MSIHIPYDGAIVFGGSYPLKAKSPDQIAQMSEAEIEEAKKPGRIYKGRLEAAKFLLENGAIKKIILTGGAQHIAGYDGDIPSESQIGKDYLVSLGVNENDIICEEKSVFTTDNLAETLNLLDRRKKEAQVKGETPEKMDDFILITNEGHMDRVLEDAKVFDMKVVGMPAEAVIERKSDFRFTYPATDAASNVWKKSLRDPYPGTWVPLALTIEDPERLRKIFEKYPEQIMTWFERQKKLVVGEESPISSLQDIYQALINKEISKEALINSRENVTKPPLEDVENYEPTYPREEKPEGEPTISHEPLR